MRLDYQILLKSPPKLTDWIRPCCDRDVWSSFGTILKIRTSLKTKHKNSFILRKKYFCKRRQTVQRIIILQKFPHNLQYMRRHTMQ